MGQHSPTDVANSAILQNQITIAFLTIAWFSLLLRIWTRTCVISNFGWDDATMILACMVFTVFCTAQLYIAANGIGTHVTSLQRQQQLTTWVFMSECGYIMSMMIIKVSVCIFFARIVVKRAHFIIIYVTAGVNIGSSLTAFFYCLFRCGPDLSIYILNEFTNNCTSASTDLFMGYQQGAFSALTDIIFVILPVLLLWNAQMDLRSKLSIGFVLSLAALGCICSIIRFPYIDGLARTKDFFWNVVNVSIWSTIEAGACITAGCIATLRPLFKHVLHRARGSNALSGSNTTTLSRSGRSTQQSYTPKSAHGSSTPHYDIALAEIDRDCCGAEDKQPGIEYSLEPISSVSLAPNGEEAITLSSDIGHTRTSMDPILGRQDLPVPELGWHYSSSEGPGKEPAKNHDRSARVSWSFRKDAVLDIPPILQRPTTAPASPDCYGEV
ncbi:hypothetical protein PtrSN002B_005341 [Pyrenophora tritici-repentis]|uniref:Rhodopsin domain-containing protein n=1 Tax=Pyrenophora tritici-repentis TaxID=45151 RepID=A0A2W1EA08_9PLEO|nr:hypothetical protein PtrV1_05447 [Pyrenophora tritici-repentis]KAF7450190.1 hypothetical protein A1F99_048060 [Pyrenophora tritici-repentis]KAF7572763.1 hypothetical protein PtrM4_076680 [Pyrenophora tritici-repentis]KAG9376160.1 hypothetical protein A1F94_013426 [Pyrenophora tritici-repentis]KAI1509429.1 hypothetical protein Ptr86124_011509 [Pyrenophora tritici-repentis]